MEVALGIAVAVLGVAIVVLSVELGDTIKTMRARDDQFVVARDDLAKAVLASERAQFELTKSQDALVQERRVRLALEGWIHDESKRDPNADLDPRDWHARVLRLAQTIAGAGDSDVSPAGGQVRPEPAGDVHPPQVASGPGPDVPRS